MADRHYYVKRTTPHYVYELHFELKYTSAHLYVGDPNDPCLSVSIPLNDLKHNNRYDISELSIAHLNKIKDMKDCILSDRSEASTSFAKELLTDAMVVIRNNYPHIHHISLTDSSFIPCAKDDTLDLLHYSVGLYGKTWYESNFNAYFVPREKFIEYKCNVADYSKPETKVSWNAFIKSIYGSLNMFAKDVFDAHDAEIHTMYDKAATYPAFFQELSKYIQKSDKCKFFKDWFERFVESFVVIPRAWYIDLYTVHVKSRRGGTRKNGRKQVLRHR
jgi:hypothetical protein